MDVPDRRTIGSMLACCVWTSCHSLLLTGTWRIEGYFSGVKLEECGAGGIVEMVAGQNTSLTCSAVGPVEWRLIGLHNQTTLIANCTESVCRIAVSGSLSEVFQVQALGAYESMITINTENITRLYARGLSINSLECFLMSAKRPVSSAAGCELNYVHPPEEVSCQAVHTAVSVNVSCVIGKVYSSRRTYKCRLTSGSPASLETVEMVTSPTSEKTIKSEVKVSGFCQFSTTLPPEEGRDDLFVSVSPSGRNYSVKFTTDDCCTTTGMKLEECGADGIVEMVAGQNTSLTCSAEGTVEWRLIGLLNQATLIANCTEGVCRYAVSGSLSEVFHVQALGAHDSMITINTENITRLYDKGLSINISLECVSVSAKLPVSSAARCGLNYVHPPEEVSCEAVHTAVSVNVSCVISKVYSSCRTYKCRLFQRGSAASLETVEMETSPTSEKTIKSEVKVSGSCQFNTTLPPEEGCCDLFVSVSPSGRNYSVDFTTDDCCTTTDQPSVSSQQPVMESVEAATVIAPASVSVLIVLVLILLIISHVTRKKRKMGSKHGEKNTWDEKIVNDDHDVISSKHFTDECLTMQYRMCKDYWIASLPPLVPKVVQTLFIHKEETRKRQEAASDYRSAVAVKEQK